MDKKSYTKKEIEKFRKIILEQIADTREIVNYNISKSSKSVTSESGETHAEEMGTENYAREMDFYMAQREGKYIENLENALKRIEMGTYGICRKCGSLISRRRLEVVSHATLCIDCKNDKERKD